VENHYATLGVGPEAGPDEIKRAFREKAKLLHPDIAGENAESGQKMRKLLGAYKLLLDAERRLEYDRIFRRLFSRTEFNYRAFLQREDAGPEDTAKLIFYELLQFEDDRAIEIWLREGGVDFPLERYLDREDWMDCAFMLAEELSHRRHYHDAFVLAYAILREERRLPYFRHFTVELETFIKELVRLHLRQAVDGPVWIECLKLMLTLGFPSKDEVRYLLALSAAFDEAGEGEAAAQALREARRRNPKARA
jgi:curved DNA-binding protein CbpA